MVELCPDARRPKAQTYFIQSFPVTCPSNASPPNAVCRHFPYKKKCKTIIECVPGDEKELQSTTQLTAERRLIESAPQSKPVSSKL